LSLRGSRRQLRITEFSSAPKCGYFEGGTCREKN
jgi:hypothetical protein